MRPPAATIRSVHDTSGSWQGIDTVLCDLDGVVWLAHQPIAGSVDAVARLRASGRRVVFVTNNSAARRAQHEQALAAIGIEAVGDVVSSAMAAAQLVAPGERALVVGGPGIVEALELRGAQVVINDGQATDAGFDAVVVGLDRNFDYDRLAIAAAAIRAGARLIGTNTDSTFPTPQGLQPGGGSILAAVATAAGADAVIGGKPHVPMADVTMQMLSTPQRSFDPMRTLMVGDRVETDGLFARRLGCRFALVRSGVSRPDVDVAVEIDGPIAIDLDVADLARVVEHLVARSHRNE